jgi:hypothetical protein
MFESTVLRKRRKDGMTHRMITAIIDPDKVLKCRGIYGIIKKEM